MSGITAAGVMAFAGAAATVYSAYSASETASKNRAQQAKLAADAQSNRPQGTKAPSTGMGAQASALSADPATSQGNSGTFLTGSGGVSPNSLNLGKNTLLGQ